jgi:hypothetical protein
MQNALPDQTRHIKKKQLRDISHKIRRVQLRMHNRKAKRNIPELNVELNSLLKRRDIIKNENMMKTPKIPRSQKICPVCNYGIGKGYHICKSKPSSSTNGKAMVGRGYARSICPSSIT